MSGQCLSSTFHRYHLDCFLISFSAQVVFQQESGTAAIGGVRGFVGKWAALFPGFGYGALYKISQRVYKFGGQPVVKEGLDKYVFPSDRSPTQQFWCKGKSPGIGVSFTYLRQRPQWVSDRSWRSCPSPSRREHLLRIVLIRPFVRY